MKRVIKISAVIVMLLTIILGWGIYHFTWDTQSISKGEFIRKVNSPKGKYTVNIYNGTGGATVDDSVIVEVEQKLTKKKKNIYFEYHCKDVEVKWLTETYIQINGKKMNIHKDVYDFRHK